MEVVIFVGGRGTRMGGQERALPKALYELGGRPVLWHVIQLYRAAGHAEFVLPLGYRGGEIARYFLDRPPHLDADFGLTVHGDQRHITYLSGPPQQLSIKFVETGIETGKGERLRRVAAHLTGDTFFATYGDGLADVNLNDLLEFHRSHGRTATVTVVRARSQFGHLDLEADGVVSRIEEKPPLPTWINGGFFVFERRIFDYLQPDDQLESDCLPRLVADRELCAYRHEGFWACMDTDRDYVLLDQMCQSGPPPWQTW